MNFYIFFGIKRRDDEQLGGHYQVRAFPKISLQTALSAVDDRLFPWPCLWISLAVLPSGVARNSRASPIITAFRTAAVLGTTSGRDFRLVACENWRKSRDFYRNVCNPMNFRGCKTTQQRNRSFLNKFSQAHVS